MAASMSSSPALDADASTEPQWKLTKSKWRELWAGADADMKPMSSTELDARFDELLGSEEPDQSVSQDGPLIWEYNQHQRPRLGESRPRLLHRLPKVRWASEGGAAEEEEASSDVWNVYGKAVELRSKLHFYRKKVGHVVHADPEVEDV